MPLIQAVLKLARNPGYPDGDPDQGYVITAPLDANGNLDADEWTKVRSRCRVVRLRPNEERHADGFLTHRGAKWFIHYDEEGEGEDEPVYRLGDHKLAVGEYVTIQEDEGPSAHLSRRTACAGARRRRFQPHEQAWCDIAPDAFGE